MRSGIYRHFKGGRYYVIGAAASSESGERVVVYIPLYGTSGLMFRPLEMFIEHVDRDGYKGPRFVFECEI